MTKVKSKFKNFEEADDFIFELFDAGKPVEAGKVLKANLGLILTPEDLDNAQINLNSVLDSSRRWGGMEEVSPILREVDHALKDIRTDVWNEANEIRKEAQKTCREVESS